MLPEAGDRSGCAPVRGRRAPVPGFPADRVWQRRLADGVLGPVRRGRLGSEQVNELTFLIALSFSAQFWPSLVLSPVAGLLADRYDRRRLVMFGNLAMVFPPLTIGVLIETHRSPSPG